jgi:hypothetical protein
MAMRRGNAARIAVCWVLAALRSVLQAERTGLQRPTRHIRKEITVFMTECRLAVKADRKGRETVRKPKRTAINTHGVTDSSELSFVPAACVTGSEPRKAAAANGMP